MSAKKGPRKDFPQWFYGPGYVKPDHGKPEPEEFAKVFNSKDDVPLGWVDHPSKLTAAPPEAAPAAPAAPLTTAQRRAAAAAKQEAYRVALLNAARDKFGPGVPADSAIAELEAGLGAEDTAKVKAANGHGS